MSDELNARLRTIVGAANVLEAEADMAPFLSDWRGRYHGRARAVVRPRDTAEVAFVADNPGRWLVHCHVLEHHAGGMGAMFEVT